MEQKSLYHKSIKNRDRQLQKKPLGNRQCNNIRHNVTVLLHVIIETCSVTRPSHNVISVSVHCVFVQKNILLLYVPYHAAITQWQNKENKKKRPILS